MQDRIEERYLSQKVKIRTLVLSKNDILELLRVSGVPIPDHPSNTPITADDKFPNASVRFRYHPISRSVGQPIQQEYPPFPFTSVTDDCPILVTLEHH